MQISSMSSVYWVYIRVRFKQLFALYKNNMRDKIYCEGRGSMWRSLNLFRHDVLVPKFVIILITIFWNLNIVLLCDELPQKIIPYIFIEWTYEK